MRLNPNMTLEEMVKNTMVAYWLRGKGISDSQWNKYEERIEKYGYTLDEIYNEWQKQMDKFR